MKQIRFFLIALCVISMNSCAKEEPQPSVEATQKNQFTTELAKLIIEQAKTETESYILYQAETGEWMTIEDKEKHDFLFAIASFLTASQNANEEIIGKAQIKATKSDGWVFIGKGKNSLDAIRIANKAMQDISQARDFEIKVVHNADGSYNVYWRYL